MSVAGCDRFNARPYLWTALSKTAPTKPPPPPPMPAILTLGRARRRRLFIHKFCTRHHQRHIRSGLLNYLFFASSFSSTPPQQRSPGPDGQPLVRDPSRTLTASTQPQASVRESELRFKVATVCADLQNGKPPTIGSCGAKLAKHSVPSSPPEVIRGGGRERRKSCSSGIPIDCGYIGW